MKIKAKEFRERYGKEMAIVDFANEHGEQYEIYIPKGGVTVYFAGDETDWEVNNLFSSDFNLWSAEELLKLADAITKGITELKEED